MKGVWEWMGGYEGTCGLKVGEPEPVGCLSKQIDGQRKRAERVK